MTASAITSFQGDYFFLSNFFPCKVLYGDELFESSEHAYMAQKTLDPDQRKAIMDQPKASGAKRVGSDRTKTTLRPDWEQIKWTTMYQIVLQKFRQNPALAELLLATDEVMLIEGNTWGDRYWGECPLGNGQNNLGKILMAVRFHLRLERLRILV